MHRMTAPATSPAHGQYIDLQVNGYGGVDFNQDDLTAGALHTACEHLERDGVAGILATVITENVERLCLRLANLVRHRKDDPLARRIIKGFHIEGPFISNVPGYVGAHPIDAVKPANVDDMKRLLQAAGGLTRIVTLAPENDPGFATTRFLAEQNITVAAGHTNASLDELRGAIDAGLSMFTHLGNACPMQIHRHDNIIQRALHCRDRLVFSFIPDGVHVHFTALRNYIDLVGVERAIVVTDAVAPAGKGPGRYKLGRWELDIADDMVARAPDGSHLVGSAITMPRIWQHLTQTLGFSTTDAAKMMCVNPSRIARLG